MAPRLPRLLKLTASLKILSGDGFLKTPKKLRPARQSSPVYVGRITSSRRFSVQSYSNASWRKETPPDHNNSDGAPVIRFKPPSGGFCFSPLPSLTRFGWSSPSVLGASSKSPDSVWTFGGNGYRHISTTLSRNFSEATLALRVVLAVGAALSLREGAYSS